MKKNASAALALSASIAAAFGTALASASASAGDVTLYGTIDTSMLYTYEKATGEDSAHSFGLASGFNTASIFGLEGSEEIGSATVSFRLENSFNSDDGTFAGDETGSGSTRLFDKEAQVTVEGAWGAVSLGRMGTFTAGEGTYDLFLATADAMDGGYGDHVGAGYWAASGGIYDNTVTYKSPTFSGVTLYAQYSFGTDADDAEHSRSKNRYAALAATFEEGNLAAALVVDTLMKNRTNDYGYAKDMDDAISVSLGGSYDFGIAKPFIGLQYGKHQNGFGGFDATEDYAGGNFDGWVGHLGAVIPAFGGELQLSAYYADADGYVVDGATGKDAAPKTDIKTWGVAAMQSYELSKRTMIYAGAGYMKRKLEESGAAGEDETLKGIQAGLGLVHSF